MFDARWSRKTGARKCRISKSFSSSNPGDGGTPSRHGSSREADSRGSMNTLREPTIYLSSSARADHPQRTSTGTM